MIKYLHSFYKVRITLYMWLIVALLCALSNVTKANSDTIYVDPTYVGGNSDGSITAPYNSWDDIQEFKDSTAYLQKRGTKCTINKHIGLYRKSHVKFGVFGPGDEYAHIQYLTADNNGLFNLSASEYCTFDSLHLSGAQDVLSAFKIADDWQASNYFQNFTKIKNCYIENFYWGIRAYSTGNATLDSLTIENVKIVNIYEDGIFLQGNSKPIRFLDINHCYVDSVNMAYQATGGGDETQAGGDCIQLSRLVDKWVIRNTYVSRLNSANKFCIIHNDESHAYTCSGIIENCVLYSPNVGIGGSAVYLSSLDSVIFRYNQVYANEVSMGVVTRYGTAFDCYYNVFSKMGTENIKRVFDIGGGPNFVSNNTFYGASSIFYYTPGFTTTRVYNNIFCDGGSAFNGSLLTTASDHNLYFNTTSSTTEANSIYDQDPLFVDPSSGNFHLKLGSPCINGAKNFGKPVDIDGTKLPLGGNYDIGAYEFIPSDTILPEAPIGLSASDMASTSFILSWGASADNDSVIGYNVYKDNSLIATTTGITETISGLTQGATYSITVRAKDRSGNLSVASNELLVTTLASSDTVAPTIPMGLTIDRIGQINFSISWIASTDNVGVSVYDIYLDGALIMSTPNTFYTVTNLIAATEYSVVVKARDAVNNNSESSSALLVTTLEMCDSSEEWANNSFTPQTNSFTAEFDVVPTGDGMDGVIGLSSGSVSGYSGLACIIRFSPDGFIQARNAGVYTSDTGNVQYFAGVSYHFKLVVDLDFHTYDILMSSSEGSLQKIGTGYAFRTERSTITQINNYATRTLSCGMDITNFSINGNLTNLALNKTTNDFFIYPNPASKEIYIRGSVRTTANVINITGKVLKNIEIEAGLNKLELNLLPGLYFIQLLGENKSVKTKKIIIQ